MPHRLGACGAARFPRHDHIETTLAQSLGKRANLRRLAGSLAAFKADEQSGLFRQSDFLCSLLFESGFCLDHIAGL